MSPEIKERKHAMAVDPRIQQLLDAAMDGNGKLRRVQLGVQRSARTVGDAVKQGGRPRQ